MNAPSCGVIVGRFQVHELHDGHLELFRQVRSRHTRVIVFVGIARTGSTHRNPLDFETRKRMIQEKFPEFTVLPLLDQRSDDVWSKQLDTRIREVADWGDVTLYGGRDSFSPHYHGQFQPVELLLETSKGSNPPSGEAIRLSLTNQVMESPDFRAGAIYAAMNQRPRVHTTVDAAILYVNRDGAYPFQEILLGKKPKETQWRFIGGFAEPGGSFENDIKREISEETHLDVGPLHYLGSATIDDWRFTKDADKIKSLFFMTTATSKAATAGDDIAEVKWFKLDALKADMLVPEHVPFFNLLMEKTARDEKIVPVEEGSLV